MLSTRINARLSGPLAAFIEEMTGADGSYETPSEYIRDLIRRDMERRADFSEHESILEGYRDIAAGRMFKSTGNLRDDLKIFRQKEKSGWK